MLALPDSRHLVRAFNVYTRRGRVYIVMEWVRGPSLRRVARRGPYDQERVIDLALTVLKGVRDIHRSGYVHGDLHSENVLVTDFNRASIKIIDFQHAVRKNALGKARARRRLPRPPIELAPETRRRTIDDRYDLYGVGYMCAYLMLGRMPTRRRLAKVRAMEERPPIWEVILKAMHRNPGERYRSASEMAKALEALKSAGVDTDSEDR